MPQRCKCPNLNGEYFSCKKASFSSENFEGMLSPRALVRGNPTQASFTAENTDVSLHGLPAHLGNHRFSGRWSPTQQQNHINTLTLEAVYSRGGYWTKFWRGCAAAERQNPPMSKGDERTRQAPCLRKLSPWRPICMDPSMPSQPLQQSPGGNRITPQIHPVSITPIKHLWLPKSLEIRYLDPSCRDDDEI